MAGYSCSVELDDMLGMFRGVLGMADMGTLEGGYYHDMESALLSERENAINYQTMKEFKIPVDIHLTEPNNGSLKISIDDINRIRYPISGFYFDRPLLRGHLLRIPRCCGLRTR